jgi:hypothetical protein
MIGPDLHVRIARPVRSIDASAAFYLDGLGLTQLFRATGDPATDELDLLMVGPAGAAWHLELTAVGRAPIVPTPTVEDLLVIYLARPVPAELVDRAVRHGGTVVPAHNPYWDTWGVTIADPDGYRVVLSSRSWG